MERVFLESKAIVNPFNATESGVEWLFIPEEFVYGFRFYSTGGSGVRVEVLVFPIGLSVTPSILCDRYFETMEEAQEWVKKTFPNVCSPITKIKRPPATKPEPTKGIAQEG